VTIVLVGLNHRTTPVELREKLALTGCALPMALEELGNTRQIDSRGSRRTGIQEGAILSTCNRLEIYAVAENRETGWRHIDAFLAGLQNIPLDEILPHLYHLEGHAAVNHLMRVSCGLDSMILGEPQVLGQVTQALGDAQSAGLIGPVLSHLFSQTIHAGKVARTQTDISRFTTSVSHAGALMVLENVATECPNILVVGAGEMAVLAAKSLHNHNVNSIRFINRTYSRAEALASRLDAEALSWHQLPEALVWADAVITATGAPHTVIYAQDVVQTLPQRQGRPLIFVDIAVPRDVEVEVGAVEGVKRCDIDDLRSIVDTNTAQREAAVPQVETIIGQETETFFKWYHSREITPVIKDLRRWANEVAQAEVAQALNKLDASDKHTADIVNRLAHRIVNKLLHEPTVRLRGQAVEGNGYGYAHAVSELFGLHAKECDMRRAVCENGAAITDATCNLQCITAQNGNGHSNGNGNGNGHLKREHVHEH
jgi:glutamyl-tRNA reductase